MPELYDLYQVLEEIEKDMAMESELQKGKVTQDDIRNLIIEKQKQIQDKH